MNGLKTAMALGVVAAVAACTSEPLNDEKEESRESNELGRSTQRLSTSTPLAPPRIQQSATLLPDGDVLIAGGFNFTDSNLDVAQRYDHLTKSLVACAPMWTKRRAHGAALLPSGDVLVAGGIGASGAIANTERWTRATNVWTNLPPMNAARFDHFTVKIGSKVLVGGGQTTGYGVTATAEIYDPALDTWTPTGSLLAGRTQALATSLPDGRVLVFGGYNGGMSMSAEIYDPQTGSFTAAAAPKLFHDAGVAAVLPNGKVFAGGNGPSAELYDPVANAWTLTGSMQGSRTWRGTMLADGTVLAVGGYTYVNGVLTYVSNVDRFDPMTGTWTSLAPLLQNRAPWTITAIGNDALIVGGSHAPAANNQLPVYSPTAELYQLSAPPPPPPPSGCTPPTGGCAHGTCTTGGPLVKACNACATTVCNADPYCCNYGWDSLCVSESKSMCSPQCQ